MTGSCCLDPVLVQMEGLFQGLGMNVLLILKQNADSKRRNRRNRCADDMLPNGKVFAATLRFYRIHSADTLRRQTGLNSLPGKSQC